MIKIFYDLETTGVDFRIHGVHQIAGYIEVDGLVAEVFDIKTRPRDGAKIEPEALKIGNVTEEQIEGYQLMPYAYAEFLKLLSKYIDRYDRTDKAWLVGFNNRQLDDLFLRAWFEHNNDTFFGSWFWSDSLDVMILASQYLLERRASMKNFKLKTVARELGLIVDEERLHDGIYDVQLTKSIYRIVTGLEMEL